MNEIFKKIINTVKDKIISDKGSLLIFCLVKRTDVETENKWDILISGDWVEKNSSQEDLVYIIELLKKEFNNDLGFLSKILILRKDTDLIKDLTKVISKYELAEGYIGSIKISDDFTIKEMYITHLDFSKYKIEDEIESPNLNTGGEDF